MSSFIDGQSLQDILIAITLIGGSALYYRSRIPAQTIKNLQDSNDSYVELDKARQKQIEELETTVEKNAKAHADERLELNKAISELTGQIKVYKELPLRELADGIKQISSTNQEILNTLKNSATTLVKTNTDIATHVEQVKQDLK